MTLNDLEWLEWSFYVKFSLLQTDFDCIIYLFTVDSVYIRMTTLTSGDVGSGVADVIRRIFGICRQKNCVSFVDATSSEP